MLKKYSTSSCPSSSRSVQWTALTVLDWPNLALIVFYLKFLAISGSIGPQRSLKLLTAFSYLISITIQGPDVMWSTIPTNSGRTPLYTSKNSSAVGLSRLNIYIEEISNPSCKIISITWPASPSCIICGFIIQHVQLLKDAVGPNALEKKNDASRLYSDDELLPWIAFLIASVPKCALIDFGATCFAS